MTVLSAILWSRSSLGLMPLLVSCTFVACRSLCINFHAPQSSDDTAVRSDFPLRFSRHTATAVPLSVAYGLPPCLQPLFHCLAPSFSELSYLKATYFYHAKVAWCCEGLPPSCVAAIAVTNKIVRNLPFSPLPPTTKRVLRTIFMVLPTLCHIPAFECM